MTIDLRDHLRAKYGSAPESMAIDSGTQDPPVEVERAFVLQAESGRTVITAPIREVATNNAGFTYLHGRLVGADTPNRNKAMWTTEDLELGEKTVAGGPLNWIHDDTRNVGCLLSGRLVRGREAAAVGLGNYIETTAALWRFLYPREADMVTRAAEEHSLAFSMECISRVVACVGDNGCGEEFPYADADAGKCCQHLREKSSVRRFVDPIFLGAAVVIPPVNPAWPDASAQVVRQAAAAAEQASFTDFTEAQARSLATAVLQWANR